MVSHAARTLQLSRALLTIVGPPVLLRVLASCVAVGVPAAIVFSPSGMRAEDLVRAMDGSAPVRAVLWTGWLLLAAPATASAFVAPGTTTLRALRLPTHVLLTTLLLLEWVAQLPWLVLFLRGAGPLEACGAASIAVAIETGTIAATRRPSRRPLAVAVIAVVMVLTAPPPLVTATLGSVLAVAGVHAAWRTAPEQRHPAWRLTRPTRPSLALTVMHLLRVVRVARSRLTFAALLASIGGAGLLTLRSEPAEHPIQRALAIMALPLVLVAALFVAPVLESERQVRALLKTLQIRRVTVAAAFLAALATPTAALAASAGAAASTLCDVAPIPFVSSLTVWAVLLASSVGLWGRRHERMKRPTSALFAIGVIVIALFYVSLVMAW